MVKLKSLTINKYRHVKPGTHLEFGRGINLVLGKNGTGKTTLLELISKVVRWEFKDLEQEEFELEWELTNNGKYYRTSAHNMTTIPPEHMRRNHQDNQHFKLSITIHSRQSLDSPERELVSFEDGTMRIPDKGAYKIESPYSFSKVGMTIGIGAHELQTDSLYLELYSLRSYARVRFDEALDYWREMVDGDVAVTLSYKAGSTRVLHVRALPATRYIYLSIGTELQRVGDPRNSLPEVLTISASNHDFGFLWDLVEMVGLEKCELVLSTVSRTQSDNVIKAEYGRPEFRCYLKNGSWFGQDRLSFGQKRFLAFLCYSVVAEHILIADELSNGMHHAMVEKCVEKIGERQAFLATQNPLLMDLRQFESEEDVRTAFVICETVEDNGHQWMAWRGLSGEEAASFYRSYQQGIQYVNEILRSRGLC